MARIDCMSDYMEGCAPEILARLTETNLESTPGYGDDRYCASAIEKIRAACGTPEADVFFLTGGTQMNKTVISSMLHLCDGVISARTGHVAVHEAGAIENSGHKVFELPHSNGKIDAETVEAFFRTFEADGNREHMPAPGMVYITHPTEYGTLYTKAEMEALSETAHRHGASLYLDGARLGYGLSATGTDVTLKDIARCCDAFYIGGTKVGALFGEAVVFPKKNTVPRFFTYMKQQGALLAKGRLLGIQFDTLFTDDLYLKLGAHADRLADRLREGLAAKGVELVLGSQTNQTFVLLTNERYQEMLTKVGMSFWEQPDPEHTIGRLVTSWATRPEDVEAIIAAF